MKVNFSKMHGLGHDVAIIDHVTQTTFLNAEQVKKLAHRNLGVGFEHLILIEPPYDPEADFFARAFNSQGEEVALCPHGARCVTRFARMKGLTNKSKLVLTTKSQQYLVKVENENQISVVVKQPILNPKEIPYQSLEGLFQQALDKAYTNQALPNGILKYVYPHCIVMVDNVSEPSIQEMKSQLFQHKDLPEETEIVFVQITGERSAQIRVFRRIIGEVVSASFSACAAAYWCFLQKKLASPATLSCPRGSLTISLDSEQSLWVKGPAELIYEGQFVL